MKKKKLHKTLKGTYISVPNREDYEELKGLLHNLGYKWCDGDSLKVKYDNEDIEVLHLLGDGSVVWLGCPTFRDITLSEFYKLCDVVIIHGASIWGKI